MYRISRHLCRNDIAFFASLIVFCGAFFIASLQAEASSITFSTGVSVAGPPAPNVQPGTQEPTVLPLVYSEAVNAVAPGGGIPVDHDGSNVGPTSAVVSGNVVSPSLISATIPAGTVYDSYFFHFDPSAASPPNYSSSITFSAPIIGVQLFSSAFALQKPTGTPYTGTLEAGDAVSGFPPGYYPSGLVSRGLEEDAMQIDTGRTRIIFAGAAFGSEIDQVRIFVAPEPNSAMLALVGLLALPFLGITRIGAFGR
jgi:hypothetical protein